jgi:hypothetical protein
MIKSYSELILLPTFLERYRYLKLGGIVGESSFGFDRYLNQVLYKSREWKSVRDRIVIRDNGSDLGISEYPIGKIIVVHHMNPITMDDIIEANPVIFDKEYLICVSLNTHNAIHFGDENLLPKLLVERRPGDTCPWK